MKRWIIIIATSFLMLAAPHKASAQFATFDASNLAQAILSFLQDGDNMVLNTEQFLQNLGLMEEQLRFLKEMDQRYRKVRNEIWKGQEVLRIAQNYEMTARMFSNYVNRMKSLDGKELQYFQVRSAINEGFNYLLFASREVKRAREYLDSKSEISEEERLKGLQECDRQVSRANSAMAKHILEKYDDIDRGRILATNKKALDDAFEIKF